MPDDKKLDNEELIEDPTIVELTDDDGEPHQFEYLATVPYEGQEYVVLMVLEDDEPEDDEEGEVIILKIDKDEDDEDIYVSVDDEATSQAVFDLFMEQLDEEDED